MLRNLGFLQILFSQISYFLFPFFYSFIDAPEFWHYAAA